MNNLQESLMAKYPALFPKDVGGETRPPICGIWAPPGWGVIIDQLCEALNDYQSNNFRTEARPTHILQYKYLSLLQSIVGWSKNRLFKFEKVFKVLNSYYGTLAKKKLRVTKFEIIPSKPIIIAQIKEKFGTLRFYCDGGIDDTARGMIRFAEFLSGRTCEITGKPGHLHVRGYWYKTLSPEVVATDKTYSDYISKGTIFLKENLHKVYYGKCNANQKGHSNR